MLKAMQGAVIGILIAVLPQLLAVLSGKASFSFSATVVDAMIGAVLTGLIKLWSTQGPEEAAIGQVIEAYMQAKMEVDAPGSTAIANNWQAIQFTVPVQPRPVETAPSKIPVIPARKAQTWPPAPQYGSTKSQMPFDAGHAGSINTVTTDKNAVVTTAMPPPPQPPLYPTYNAPPAPAPHVADMATGMIPTANFVPPTQ
jgi:hypothetical protein